VASTAPPSLSWSDLAVVVASGRVWRWCISTGGVTGGEEWV
jgi:hypothetical protein